MILPARFARRNSTAYLETHLVPLGHGQIGEARGMMAFMRLEQVKRTDSGLFIDEPDRPVGAYWVKLKATGEVVPATYEAYEIAEEEDLYGGLSIEDLKAIELGKLKVFGYGWCLNQDPEEEWRLIPEAEFEYIGPKIPTEEQIIEYQRFLQRTEALVNKVLA